MLKRDNHDINLGRILTQKADKLSDKLDNSVLPVQSYSVAGPSSEHNYPGAGPSPLDRYRTAGPSSVHHYSTAGSTIEHDDSTSFSSSVPSYPTAGPSSLITSQAPIGHPSGSGPVNLTGISTSSESSGLGGPVPEYHLLQPQQPTSMLPMSAGVSRNLRVNAHLTTRGSGMSSSANLELPNDSIRGSDVKKILRRIEIVVENQLQHQKDLEQLKNQARPNGTINHPTVTEIQGVPLQTMAELERYEISLRDEEVRRQLVDMISSIGGNGFKDAIERALSAVASDKVLRDVNWLGRKRKDKQKKGCHDMLFIKSILEGVRKQPEFEDVVRNNNTVFQTHVKNCDIWIIAGCPRDIPLDVEFVCQSISWISKGYICATWAVLVEKTFDHTQKEPNLLISKDSKIVIEVSSDLLYWVYLDKKRQRSRIINPEVNPKSTVTVICVNSGETANILFGSVRLLCGIGTAIEDLREWTELAQKNMIAVDENSSGTLGAC
ncbi:hypothetical protein DAPPUDRAFT_326290 [Daphnia pulex]|uniref:DUF4806 domain-containing protein n=1 Tax=Daphnia pulex TaxID=6669 RepID=E9H7B1_DAPPU|nr:hypothetical protein DAPPUDRAFT_326290 [Daphnia pulex]|eukprot:EFX72398.1 hypothetical protein DAPPUDRAFT_326290 [Daphnia pulex]